MTSQLAGHLIVDCLLAQGVTHAFCVPGESFLAVLVLPAVIPAKAHCCP